jgi:O-antigen/teichoic acid export membrane protein
MMKSNTFAASSGSKVVDPAVGQVRKVKSFPRQVCRLIHRTSNPILFFTLARYFSYGLNFLRGLLVASFLGPFYLGIWGFLMLVQQYLMYGSFGVHNAVNVELSVQEDQSEVAQRPIRDGAIILSSSIALIFIGGGAFIQFARVPLFPRFNFGQYALLLAILVGLTLVRQVFTNIYRAREKLNRIIASDLQTAIITLIPFLFFRDERLIIALLAAMSATQLISVILYVIHPPFAIGLQFDLTIARRLLLIGIPLLIYNLSYELMTIAGRTVISAAYTVADLGYFTLANSITAATMLGFRTIIWVKFPSLLNQMRRGAEDAAVRHLITRLNQLFGTAVFLIVFIFILLAPIIRLILPQYTPVVPILGILLLMQAILAAMLPYNVVAVARRKQLRVAFLSGISVLFILGGSLLCAWLALETIWVAITMLLGGLLFAVLQSQLGAQLIGDGRAPTLPLPPGILAGITLFFIGILTENSWWQGGGLLLFLLLRRQAVGDLFSFVQGKIIDQTTRRGA